MGSATDATATPTPSPESGPSRQMTCLVRVLESIQSHRADGDSFLAALPEMLAAGFHHPESVGVHIRCHDKTHDTPNYRQSGPFLATPITVHGNPVGDIRIDRLAPLPGGDIPDFTPADHTLLTAVAERLGHFLSFRTMRDALADSEERLRLALQGAKQGLYDLDLTTGDAEVTPEYATMLGYDPAAFTETNARWLERLHPDDHQAVEAVFRQYVAGELPEYRVEFRQKMADGRYKWILSLGKIVTRAPDGTPLRLVGTHTDIDARKRAEEMVAIRLRLTEYGYAHDLDALLQKTLDEVCEITDSPIGFYHFVHPDQETLTLQAWSTRTLKEFCQAEGKGLHYPVSQAGVWTDCVATHEPVIHNDYMTLPHRKGLPEGHAKVVRELVVPVLRDDAVVAILGVGNKATDYDQQDVALVTELADLAHEITTRKKAQDAHRRLAMAVEHTSETILITNADGIMEYVNPAAEKISGYSQEELIGENPRIFNSGHQASGVYTALWETILSGRTWSGRLVNKRKDNSLFTEDCTISPVFGEDGRIVQFVAVKKDISAELDLEAHLRQTQRMDSVGRLAGGVAHDFNNIISIITGYAEMAVDGLTTTDPLRDDINEILIAANRSESLIAQLLAFARKQPITPRIVDLNQLIVESEKMIRRLLGEEFELTVRPDAQLWRVRMDPTQVGQLLANLAANAREAVVGVGTMTIETGNASLDQAFCDRNTDLYPGDYATISVSDSGDGMDPQILSRIFDPYFSTKSDASGMGLSTVYGMVRQNNGAVIVRSQPGQGTSFRIYLPRADADAETPTDSLPNRPAGGTETIMVVEDDPQFRKLCRNALKRHGYSVIATDTPGEALILWEKHEGTIDMLLTDVVMPIMNGKELADRVRSMSATVRVLYMSGYPTDIITERGVLAEGAGFIKKPFATRDLVQKVRDTLNTPPSPS